jgi:transposase
MWTEAHRARHDARLKKIVSTEAAGEIARMIDALDPPSPEGRPRTSTRRAAAAIAWHLRVGGPWSALPAGFPPWKTVYGLLRRWLEAGIWDALVVWCVRLRRLAGGRSTRPTLCIIDTRSVKCLAVAGPRGYDAGKKTLGRKHVLLVDADGAVLALAVVPGSTQDRDCLPALSLMASLWGSLERAVFDGAFIAERCTLWCERLGMTREIVKRPDAAKGFVALPRCWVVERDFGWLSHWNGLTRDRAGRLDVAHGRLAFVSAFSAAESILNPLPMTVSCTGFQTGC